MSKTSSSLDLGSMDTLDTDQTDHHARNPNFPGREELEILKCLADITMLDLDWLAG